MFALLASSADQAYWNRLSAIGTMMASLAALIAAGIAAYQSHLTAQSREDLFGQVLLDKQIDACSELIEVSQTFLNRSLVLLQTKLLPTNKFVDEKGLEQKPDSSLSTWSKPDPILDAIRSQFDQLTVSVTRAKLVLPEETVRSVNSLYDSAFNFFLSEIVKGGGDWAKTSEIENWRKKIEEDCRLLSTLTAEESRHS